MRRAIGIIAMGLALAAPAGAVEPDTAIQAPGSALLSSLAAVSGTAADADGTVANVQVRLCETTTNTCWDGFQFDLFSSYFDPTAGWYNAAAADGTFDSASEAWTDTVSVNALNGMEGPFVIEARAVDDAADTDSTPASQAFVIDATPPDTAVLTPPHGSSSLATTEITGTYIDLNISKIHIRVQDLNTGQYWDGAAGFSPAEFWSTATIAGPFFSQTFSAELVSGHTYNIVTKGFDTVGNVQSVFTVGQASTTFTHDVSPPSTAAMTGLFVSSASASWALVSGATGYSLVASTEAANPPTAVASSSNSSSGAENAAALTGLSANTTYYLGVRALGPSTATAYNQFAASATLANPPTGTAAAGAASSALALSWTANSNPAGTLYEVQADDDAGFGSVNGSSATRGTSAAVSGLTPNTTYHLRVRAVSHGQTPTAFDTSVTTATDAAVPAGSAAAAQSDTQITFSWTANSNPAGTLYEVQADDDAGFGSVNGSSATFGTSAAFSGLTPNTTYHLRVRAVSHGQTPTAFDTSVTTATDASVPAGSAAAAQDSTQITLSWTANSNPSGTRYEAQADDDAGFGSLFGSSSTLGTSAAFTGLTPNTTYYLRVRAVSHGQEPTAYDTSVATATDAAVPGAPAAVANSSSQITINWTANSNPSGTSYRAEISTASDFSGTLASSATLLTSAIFSSLADATTYYARVKATGHGGGVTAYSVSTFTVTPVDYPTSPPSTATMTGLFVSSAAASWALVSGATGYSLIASTGAANPPTGAAVSSDTSSGAENSAVLTGLSVNTTYYFGVRALGPSTATAYNQFATSATLANPPAGTGAAGTTSSSLTLSWTANSNPAGTRYEAQADDDAGFGSVNGSSATLNTSATISGLTPNTTYHLRVRAVNHGQTATDYDTSVTTATDAAVPAVSAAVAQSSTRITIIWTANSNPAGTSYTAEVSTASDFSGTLSSSATLLTSATFYSLSEGTTYYARVRAVGHGGAVTAYTSSTFTVTDANAAPPDTISGTVTVNPNREVNLVKMTLSASGVADSTVYSDASGNWSFTGLSTDTGIDYTIQASWKLSDGDATSIVSQSGHTVGTTGIAIGLGLNVNLGSITGTLAVPGNAPAGGYSTASAAPAASGAYVEVYRDRLAGTVPADSQGRFTVPNLLPGTYQLRPFNGVSFGPMTTVRVSEGETAVAAFKADLLDPKTFYFYPNPARDQATIRFETGVSALEAQVFIFDIAGSLVRELRGPEAARSGSEVYWNWDLTNSRGRAVASGVYLVRLQVVDRTTGSKADAIKKLAVVR